ncbi:hypothetical protein [Dactylosporangium salmoneum]|uniref:Transposase n=1 Tax=Dactylosporangium salmoneum TaxID=53361 RepID=A0ABN3I7P3_9ACTN
MSVLRLPLDVHEPRTRRTLERVFAAAFTVRRAVQRDARARVDAYWAARRERAAAGPDAVRGRLGLSRSGLEHAAYRHVDGAPHVRRYLTKALAMHLAGGVWEATERHLFPDASGRRHGRPRPGGWWEFATIPGRARSHTRARKWETFRLVGSLAGHCAAFEHAGRLWQPRRMPAVTATAASGKPVRSWWEHDGPLAIVCTGLGGGDLVVPVRLPQGPGRRPVLEHYLADPNRWHKVDLVRYRDPGAAGGWRYEAHLMILGPGYTSPAVTQRRQAAAQLERRGGVDVNVSNLTVVSVPTGPDGGLAASRVARTGEHDAVLAAQRLRQRRRNRALERSRRAANPTQYRLSPRQQRRADRRHAAGLPPVQTTMPGGPRVANTAGIPARAYRHDTLTNTYQQLRGRAAADGAARTRAGHTRARITAAALIAVHGLGLVVEDTDIRAWARRWGRGIHAFTPGMLLTALRRETTAVAAHTGRGLGLVRAGTRHTAWTQHCLCSQRVPKSLADRRHHCPGCGLTGDRDLVAALIGAHTVLTDPAQPGTARVDWDAARATLDRYGVETINGGLQGALTESTGTHHPDPHHTGGRPRRPQPTTGQHGRWQGARRTFGTSPRQPRMSPTTTPVGRTTPERRDAHPGLSIKPGITTGLRHRP